MGHIVFKQCRILWVTWFSSNVVSRGSHGFSSAVESRRFSCTIESQWPHGFQPLWNQTDHMITTHNRIKWCTTVVYYSGVLHGTCYVARRISYIRPFRSCDSHTFAIVGLTEKKCQMLGILSQSLRRGLRKITTHLSAIFKLFGGVTHKYQSLIK